MYVWVCRVELAEGITLGDKGFGGIGKVGDHVGDVTGGDVVFGGA